MNRPSVAHERIKASPLARKRARQLGVGLGGVAGSGPGGRIIARDVAAAAQDSRKAHSVPTASAVERSAAVLLQPAVGPERAWRSIEHDEAAGEIALIESTYGPGSYVAIAHDDHARARAKQAHAAHLVPQQSLHADVRLDDVERALHRLNGGPLPGREGALQLTVRDLLVKAMGLALRQVQEANVSYTSAAMFAHRSVVVAVLSAPHAGQVGGYGRLVVTHADLKSLSEISAELCASQDAARSTFADTGAMAGGVTTVVDFSGSPVVASQIAVQPPQSSVLVLGRAEPRAVAGADGAIEFVHVARLSLGFDTRSIDLATAVRLLSQVAVYLDDPMRMLV